MLHKLRSSYRISSYDSDKAIYANLNWHRPLPLLHISSAHSRCYRLVSRPIKRANEGREARTRIIRGRKL